MNDKALILGHLGLGDQIHYVGLVRYLREKYNKVIIIAKDNYSINNIKQFYSDDKSIYIYKVNSDRDISPSYGASSSFFNRIFKECDHYLMGFHKHGIGIQNNFIHDLPFCFYDDVNIPYNIFWDAFHVNIPKKSNDLYNILKDDKINEYVFVHNSSSGGIVFTDEYINKKTGLDKNEILFVNPCMNMYNKDHKYYEIAEKLQDHLLLDYKDLIENASYVILSDSSFLCLSLHLKIKTDNCYGCRRKDDGYNYTYEHIWSDKYKSNDKTLKQFIELI